MFWEMNIIKSVAALLLIALAIKISLPPNKLDIQNGDTAKDSYVDSKRGIPMIIITHFLGYFLLVLNFALNENSPAYSPEISILEIVSVVVASVGGMLRLWSYRVLGKYFTFQIGIRKNHQLIENGPYSFLKHPSYTGAIICHSALTWFLGLRSATLYFPLMALFTAMLFLRIQDEEKLLRGYFGKEKWDSYSKKRYALIPFVY